MDDLSRLPFDCQCDSCLPDPDPATNYTLPGDLVYGSPEWFAIMATIPVADPDEFLSEYDLLAGDRPDPEEEAWWEGETREHPAACEIMLAEAQVRQDYEQYNGFLDVLDETSPSETERWFRRDVTEF